MPTAAPTDPGSGEKRGKYELLGRIGHGGMAEVHLARQHGPMGFEKLVAIKRLLPHFASEEQFVRMFLDEARIAARINHPNVVQIFELGSNAEGYFLAMEFLAGESLARVLGEGIKRGQPLPPALGAGVMARVCEGLHHAHTQTDAAGNGLGIVHRDVSPQNVVLLYDGRVKVLDFGIAKARQRVAETTVHGLKGKYAYMSPEQCLGKSVDARSDIFSCGILLWELLARRRLFKHKSRLMILKMITEGHVVPPSVVNPDVPRELDEVVLRALAKPIDDRFESAEQMSQALDEAIAASTDPKGRVAISQYMQNVFGEDEKSQKDWINTALSPGGIEEVATAERWLELVPDGDQQSVWFAPNDKTASGVDPRRGHGWLLPLVLALAGLSIVVALLARPPRQTIVVRPNVSRPNVPQPVVVPPASQPGPTSQPVAVERPVAAPRPVPHRTKLRKRGTGQLSLMTQPWATIYHGKTKLGDTPLIGVKLPAGRVVLRAINKEAKIRQSIVVWVRKNQHVRRTVALKKK